MPAITYADFSGGLDRRLPINVQESSKLWVLRDAYVTLGKRIRKRPGLTLIDSRLTNTVGLKAVSGRLKVFGTDTTFSATLPDLCDYVTIDDTGFGWTLTSIKYADLFQGFLYVVAGHSYVTGFGKVCHHYVDGTPSTLVVDAPATESVTKAASRIFAIDGEVVRYSAATDARDWTTSNDAGFLPVSLQQDTKSECTAVGTYQDSLVVFFDESAQVWTVAVDPSANTIKKRIDGVGCNAFQSLAGFANDLMFLSPYGFRSMTVQAQTDRIDDTDVGVAVDSLVRPDIETTPREVAEAEQVFSLWVPEFGQYWAIFDMGGHSKAWVYTHSRSSKIACWSEYVFPVLLTAGTTLGGKLYLRGADNLYTMDPTVFVDPGDEPIEVEVQMAFQDAKQPGVAKQFYGADYVVTGSPSVSFKYDPRDLDKEGVPMTIPGDTRPGDIQGVEMVCSAIAPVFRHALNEEFELDALSLYYNALTNFV